ncbi:MAG: ABC transporter permease [bacterium]|uniref:Permease protein n=1 Tax=Aplysina aerophoba bacterial symbiont clone pAPKS18 TaxID=377637 RepID=A4U8R8_9BACT|nr:permease protein [Aplysina aerophoba bacterial symbiont clone pAPKS18]MCY4607711.1 ABC transporter permease [bacterium]
MAMPSYATTLDRIWYVTFRVICCLIFAFLIIPIIVIMPLSFNSEPYFTYPMPGFSLRWYGDFFSSPQWLLGLQNSIIVGVFATLVATVLGTLAALGLNRAEYAGKSTILAVLISPIIVPIVITAAGMFYFYAKVGLTGTLAGLVFAHATIGVPFVVITVSATLAGFDYNLIRAGASLGGDPLRVFFKITLPLILPGVVAGALFAFITSWDELVIAIFLASTEEHTLPRRMWSGIRELLSPTIMAVATMLILTSIGLMIVMELLRRRSERLRGITP